MTQAVLLRRARVVTASAAFLVTALFWFAQISPGVIGSSEATSQAFSNTTRNLGISALLLLLAAAPLGLVVGRRLVRGPRAAVLYTAHRTLSLCGLAVVDLRLMTLLGVSSLAPAAARFVVPSVWPYRTTATGIGVIGTWILALLGPGFYLRSHIGVRRWRSPSG